MLLNPKYQHLKEWLERLPEDFEQLGEVIYDKRNQLRVIEAPDGTLVNAKRYCKTHLVNRVVYSLGIRQPKGLRAFLYPTRLLERGISTPEPIAYIEQRQCGLLGLSYFISVQSPLSHTLYEFGDAQEGTYEEMAHELGRFTAMMHNNEVLHLDYSPGNILWDKDGDGYHFAVVDINRMRFGTVDIKDGCAALRRLWGPKRFIELIARSYAAARGFDEDEAVRLTMEARTTFWTRYQRRHPVDFPLEI
ncbi:MAG: aminoglycoside phosphotransferase [Muribaculaceae bacterium]|nr:aminoglycoside phosphotransferase [Muribaculaceae bacterium]